MVQPQETHRPALRSVLEAYVNVTAATYTAKAGDRIIGVNRAGAVTITLPTAEVRKGRTFTIKDESGAAATNNITIDTEGSENIDGSATDVISDNFGGKTYYSDGTNWFELPLLPAASVAHSATTGQTASDHHTKYTDANATTAVEAEATLDLTGDVTIAAAKSLAVDTIAEKTAAGGVTIDGVLLKDSLVNHEYGGLEADVNAGDGFVEIKAGATTVIKSNTAATAGPGVSDDSAAGYAVGSVWIDTTADKAYVCLDATATAAVWTEITQGGGSGPSQATQAALEAETNENTYAPPDLLKHTPGAVKVWAKWEMVDPSSLLGNHNISSLTDQAVGKTKFDLTTAFSSADWAPAILVATGAHKTGNADINTADITIWIYDDATAFADPGGARNSWLGVGDQ